MRSKFNLAIFLSIVLVLMRAVYAVEPLPSPLVSFTSQSGLHLLKKDLNSNLLKLLSHFTTQKTGTYCGIASTVMILNSTGITPPKDSNSLPYHYFNQNNFFNDKVNKIVRISSIKKDGVTLDELTRVINTFGLKATPYHANNLTLDDFRKTMKKALENDEFIIVNFFRPSLNQVGAGHHSPVAAYDKETDQFLILDVARFKYPAFWVKTQALWNAVNTIDKEKNYRGFIVVKLLC